MNSLGGNAENMYWLGEGMQYLPNNLKSLKLDLDSNNLGGNSENIKWLGEVLR